MPRAVNNDGKRINLPRPPGAAGPGPQNIPQPPVNPRAQGEVRARPGEVTRPAADSRRLPRQLPGAPSQSGQPADVPQPPGGPQEGRPGAVPPGAEGRPQLLPPGQQLEGLGGDQQPRGEVPPGPDELEAQMKLEEKQEAAEEAPPAKRSPLGDDSPLEQELTKATQDPNAPPAMDAHLRKIALPDTGLPPERQKQFEQQAVRDYKRFGTYRGQDDPNSPPPPIRPGKANFNPETAQWILPEGEVSALDRLKQGFG